MYTKGGGGGQGVILSGINLEFSLGEAGHFFNLLGIVRFAHTVHVLED